MMDEDYEVDEAVETLLRADEIRKDPKLMEKVAERSKEKQKALKSIAGLRKRAAEVMAKGPDEEKKDYGDDPELRTEEDKAALQEANRVDEKLDEMGMLKKK